MGMCTISKIACAGLSTPSVSPGYPTRSPTATATSAVVPPSKPTLLDRPFPSIQPTSTCVPHQTLTQSLTTLVLHSTLPFLEETHHSPELTACIGPEASAYLGAFNNPKTTNNTVSFGSNLKILIVDCGTSAMFTPDKNDFISYKPYNGKVQGPGKKHTIGKGTARYTITDNNGEDAQLLVSNAYHILDTPVRLLCPQQ
eukprot:13756026-Ditylum_brightwellii.AAC.1